MKHKKQPTTRIIKKLAKVADWKKREAFHAEWVKANKQNP